MNAWQPIETAPMDGTEILLASVGQVFQGVSVADRVTIGQYATGDQLLKFVGDTDYPDEYEVIEPFWISWDGGFTEENPPTHWMPLPEPPK